MGKIEDDMLYREIFMKSASTGGGGITPTGTKSIDIVQNGTVTSDVTDFATVKVDTNVPIPDGYVKPHGAAGVYYNANGKYTEDVTKRESIDITVDVPIPDGCVKPTGTAIINIDSNGTVEQGVNDLANVRVNVNVPVPDDYVHVDGEINLTENGTFDVSGYKSAYVYVPVPEGYVTPERYHGDITLVSECITDFTRFCVAGEEGVGNYWLMARPGFSTQGGKDFTRCFADFPITTKSLPCSLNLINAETTTNMFESSKYIENVEIVEGTIRHDISFVPIKCLQNASILSILKGLDTTQTATLRRPSLRLPSMCFNGQTSSIILADTEMNTVYQAALTAGWTITFNLAD